MYEYTLLLVLLFFILLTIILIFHFAQNGINSFINKSLNNFGYSYPIDKIDYSFIPKRVPSSFDQRFAEFPLRLIMSSEKITVGNDITGQLPEGLFKSKINNQGIWVKANGINYFAFRGTHSNDELMLDMQMIQTPFKDIYGNIYPQIMVHQGFLKYYQETIPDLLKVIENIPEDEIIVFTGHSLGSSTAAMCALGSILSGRVSSERVVYYGYGVPRIGNHEFVQILTKEIKNIWIIINTADLIPNLPPETIIIENKKYHYDQIPKQFNFNLTVGENLGDTHWSYAYMCGLNSQAIECPGILQQSHLEIKT